MINNQVSWRIDGQTRQHGTFAGYTDDGRTRVRRGGRIETLDPTVNITWEVDEIFPVGYIVSTG
jgi:hypothetical protein